MRANQYVDAVDLVERKAVGRAAEMAGAHGRRPPDSEALRRQGNPARGLKREFLDFAAPPVTRDRPNCRS
jgi:hypothetical protein